MPTLEVRIPKKKPPIRWNEGWFFMSVIEVALGSILDRCPAIPRKWEPLNSTKSATFITALQALGWLGGSSKRFKFRPRRACPCVRSSPRGGSWHKPRIHQLLDFTRFNRSSKQPALPIVYRVLPGEQRLLFGFFAVFELYLESQLDIQPPSLRGFGSRWIGKRIIRDL